MKKKIFITLLLISPFLMGQDKTGSPTGHWYKDTLTTSQDTIDIPVGNMSDAKHFSFVAYNPSGADTLDVYTLSADASVWSKHAVVSLASGSTAAQAFITTTAVEFVILDTNPAKVRLISNSNDGSSTVFIFAGKTGELIR